MLKNDPHNPMHDWDQIILNIYKSYVITLLLRIKHGKFLNNIATHVQCINFLTISHRLTYYIIIYAYPVSIAH